MTRVEQLEEALRQLLAVADAARQSSTATGFEDHAPPVGDRWRAAERYARGVLAGGPDAPRGGGEATVLRRAA